MKLLRIKSSYFVVGVEINEGKVIRCPPIVKYMKGWNIDKVIKYCRNKGWKMGMKGDGDNESR